MFAFTSGVHAVIGRPPMLGSDVVFQLQSFGGNPPTFQCLVKLPCLGGNGFAGEVAPSQEEAKELACEQAMPFLMSQSRMGMGMKRPLPMVTWEGQPVQKKGKTAGKGQPFPMAGNAMSFGKGGKDSFARDHVVSLTRDQVEAITSLIFTNGGAVSMGRISQEYLGVKRAHLADHFEIAKVDHLGSFEVRLPGLDHPASQMNTAEAEPSFIQQPESYQELNAPMGNLQVMQDGSQSASNSGQLQGFIKNFFDNKGFGFVTPADGSEDLFAHIEDNAFMRDFHPGQPVSYDQEWDDRKGKYKATNATPRGGVSPGMPATAPLVTKGQGKMRVDKKGRPIVELDATQVAEITTIISSAGGTVPLGRLSQVFPGIKPTQLADHFICENGAFGMMEIKLQ